MRFKLPIGDNPISTLTRWASEIRSAALITEGEVKLGEWESNVIGSGTIALSNVAFRQSDFDKIGGLFIFDLTVTFTVAGTGSYIYVSPPVRLADMNIISGRPATVDDGAGSHDGRWGVTEGQIAVFKPGLAAWAAGAGGIAIQGFAKIA